MMGAVEPKPAVVALVVNWRQAAVTAQCLADLDDCGYPGLTTLVIDNGSGDGSVEVLRSEAERMGEGFEVIAFPENLGYCAAINRGLAAARERGAEMVLLVNNDVRLPPGFLDPLADALRSDPQLACVGPTMLRPDGRVWCQGGDCAFYPNMLRMRDQGRAPAPTDAGPVAVDFMPGACALYRLRDLEAVGDLDESYFMYWEEVDLGWRLRNVGKVILWLPWVRVTHHFGSSSGGGRSAMRKYMTALNSVRYLKAHGTGRQWCAFLLFDCLLWPFTWLAGTPPSAMLAKGRGILAGLLGRRVTVNDVPPPQSA